MQQQQDPSTFRLIDKFPLFIISMATFFFSFNAYADYDYWNPIPEYNVYSPVQIEVIEDSGRVLNQYSAERRRDNVKRAYIEAHKGKRYSIRIRNTSDRRVGLVIAVDGRNILSGKKSYLGKHEKMYILDPYETSRYKGWRTNKNRVNRFYFTSAGDSYANAWGDNSAMGVIAVAVYEEKPRRHNYNEYRELAPNAMGRSRSGVQSDESGTGFGREEYSPTVKVRFKAKNQPVIKYFFKYEWRHNLCKRGVIECQDYRRNHREHNRFWPNDSNNGYAPYPPGYYNKRQWDGLYEDNWD